MKFAQFFLKLWRSEDSKTVALCIIIIVVISLVLGIIVSGVLVNKTTIENAYNKQNSEGFKSSVDVFISSGANLKDLPEKLEIDSVKLKEGKINISITSKSEGFFFPAFKSLIVLDENYEVKSIEYKDCTLEEYTNYASLMTIFIYFITLSLVFLVFQILVGISLGIEDYNYTKCLEREWYILGE